MPTQGASITVAGGLDLVSSSHALFRTPGAATILENFESSTTGGYRRINGYTKWGGNSSVAPSGNLTDIITGLTPYAGGVVACQGSGIFWSNNGINWLQINKNTYVTKTGTVSVSSGSATVTGSGTAFTTEFAVNDRIQINSINYRVLSITSNTVLTLDSNVQTTASSQAVKKSGILAAALSGATTITRSNQSNNQFATFESDGAYGSLYITDGTNKIAEFQITVSSGVNTYYFEELASPAPSNPKICEIFSER